MKEMAETLLAAAALAVLAAATVFMMVELLQRARPVRIEVRATCSHLTAELALISKRSVEFPGRNGGSRNAPSSAGPSRGDSPKEILNAYPNSIGTRGCA